MMAASKKNVWFKQKKYGWGWTPATLEGWLVVAVFIGSTLYYAADGTLFMPAIGAGLPMSYGIVLSPFAFILAGFVIIVLVMGNHPQWNWSDRK